MRNIGLILVISWIKALELLRLNDSLHALEIASGDVAVVPYAEDMFSEENDIIQTIVVCFAVLKLYFDVPNPYFRSKEA